MRSVLLFAAALAGTGAALAHDAFYEPAGAPGTFNVRFADDGKPLAYPPAKLKRAWAYKSDGSTLALTPTPGDGLVRVAAPADADLLALEFENGFFSRTTQGTIEKPMNEAPGAVSAVWAKKTGKYVLRWSAPVLKPLGLQYEIVPLSAAAPRAGDTITVRVLWDGKPVEGVKVSRGEHETGEKTDADGRAAYKVQPGRNFVWSERRIRVSGDPRYDTLSVATNLVFEAP
jgi:nickel transport protein